MLFLSCVCIGWGIRGDPSQRGENRVPLCPHVRRDDYQCWPIDGIRTAARRYTQARVGASMGAGLLGLKNERDTDAILKIGEILSSYTYIIAIKSSRSNLVDDALISFCLSICTSRVEI